jgi:signal transduction histidine kinase
MFANKRGTETTTERPTLLVVDDEIINLDIVVTALGHDYTVRVATNGADALDSVKEFPPDLILLDVMMPGMDGFEVCRRLKQDPVTEDIPVIFLTAIHQIPDKVLGFSAGGVDYVTKPFQCAEVQARLASHLADRRRKHELQRSLDRLRELETQRDSLVHMIVHDMRSPLTVVLANLQLAETESMSQAVAACIRGALDATRTLTGMASTLLDVSKMEAGQMTLALAAVDIDALVREELRMADCLKGQRTLTITSPEAVEAFAGDAGLIRRILQNLIGNALKFTDAETGSITVRIETPSEDLVRVSVADNGRGIPPEYRERVFDKFYQVAARQQGHVHSSGLGLTFCKLAVEAHGGRIGLESDAGNGSTFWFELPRRSSIGDHADALCRP